MIFLQAGKLQGEIEFIFHVFKTIIMVEKLAIDTQDFKSQKEMRQLRKEQDTRGKNYKHIKEKVTKEAQRKKN